MPKAYGTVPTIEGEEIEVSATGEVMSGARTKQGHVCCGGCCDVRRASIIVDIIIMISLCFNVASLFAVTRISTDDDHLQDVIDALPIKYISAVFILEMVLYGIAIHGAVKFIASQVLVGFIVYCIGVVIAIFGLNLVGIVINVLFAYPHWYLYQEIKQGTMTAENYHNEEHSCCCV